MKQKNILPRSLMLELEIEFNGKRYKQPECRIKTTPEGCLMLLIKNEEGKWQGVKGKLFIKKFVLRKEYYTRGRKRIPNWILNLFCKNI